MKNKPFTKSELEIIRASMVMTAGSIDAEILPESLQRLKEHKRYTIYESALNKLNTRLQAKHPGKKN